jgi:hypothetical protein
VRRHQLLARRIAHRYRFGSVPYDDLEQAARYGWHEERVIDALAAASTLNTTGQAARLFPVRRGSPHVVGQPGGSPVDRRLGRWPGSGLFVGPLSAAASRQATTRAVVRRPTRCENAALSAPCFRR